MPLIHCHDEHKGRKAPPLASESLMPQIERPTVKVRREEPAPPPSKGYNPIWIALAILAIWVALLTILVTVF